jgi:hypothetical protein
MDDIITRTYTLTVTGRMSETYMGELVEHAINKLAWSVVTGEYDEEKVAVSGGGIDQEWSV